MKRFLLFCLFSFAPLYAIQHDPVLITEYSAAVTIDARRSEISGTASLWLRVAADSIDRFHFTVPSYYDLDAVRDIDDDRFSYRQSRTDQNRIRCSVELPSFRYRDDSFFVKIVFEGVMDTSSYQKIFVNPREFILPYRREQAWLPRFDAPLLGRSVVHFDIDESFTVVGNDPADSIVTGDGRRTHFFSMHSPLALDDALSFCGSTTMREKKKTSADSLISVSLFITPSRFDDRFADSLLTFLTEAASYFKNLTENQSPFRQQFVFIGEDNIAEEFLRTRNGIIERNSPAFLVYDSTVFYRSLRNPWLVELARSFCLTHLDSLAFFDDSWAGYLATKFLLSRHPDASVERRERLDLMINAMSFYPANPLSAGRNSRLNESEVLSFKGRYVLLMLESILGTPSFELVLKRMHNPFSRRSISLGEFQRLCEEEYGSPLDWFFHQWFTRSTVPEYVMQWSQQKTGRGVTLVTLSIEQRGDVFTGPMTVYFSFGQKKIPKRIFIERAKQEFRFPFPNAPSAVDLDPHYAVLRWLLDIRILAHARSSRLFRVFNKDVSTSEREALLTLELDPANATGSAPIAYFSLGKLAVIERDPEKAKEYFLKGMQSHAVEEASLYPLLSLVRFANVLEMEGKRAEAIPLYERAVAEGKKNPSLFAPVIVEGEKYLRTPFVSSDDLWYGLY